MLMKRIKLKIVNSLKIYHYNIFNYSINNIFLIKFKLKYQINKIIIKLIKFKYLLNIQNCLSALMRLRKNT